MKMPENLEPTCQSCVFFRKKRCHRHPPTVFYDRGYFVTAFPEPKPDWLCGEWKWVHAHKEDLDNEE